MKKDGLNKYKIVSVVEYGPTSCLKSVKSPNNTDIIDL